ncbi:MAG: hypothetical protein SPI30_06115 [Prevotella sp.]|nr:hypothetical protein [Prevotella sp.]
MLSKRVVVFPEAQRVAPKENGRVDAGRWTKADRKQHHQSERET